MINCLVRTLRKRRPSIRADVEGATGKEHSDGVANCSGGVRIVTTAPGWRQTFRPLGVSGPASPSRWCRRKQTVDRLRPRRASLVERQAEEFLHPCPAFDVDQRL